jgi:hypothetical protein
MATEPSSMSRERGPQVDEVQTWPELAVGLYERLTGRGAEITYEFDDLEVRVPDRMGPDADHARWRLDGTVRIRTRNRDEGGD